MKPSLENMLDTVATAGDRDDSEILCTCFLDSDEEKSKAFAVGGNDCTVQVGCCNSCATMRRSAH